MVDDSGAPEESETRGEFPALSLMSCHFGPVIQLKPHQKKKKMGIIIPTPEHKKECVQSSRLEPDGPTELSGRMEMFPIYSVQHGSLLLRVATEHLKCG